MTILDTSVIVERIKKRELIREDITAVTFVEYPRIIYYKHFHGGIIFPVKEDFILAHKIQLELLRIGKPQAFADLLIAAITINRDEELVTYDKNFIQIRQALKNIGYRMKLKLV